MAGHDVEHIAVVAPGVSDREVLSRAAGAGRILLTFDKDLGERAQATTLPATCGIVLFCIPVAARRNIGQQLALIVSRRTTWTGHFSVAEPGRVRMRRLRI